jgi:hypothetical protein
MKPLSIPEEKSIARLWDIEVEWKRYLIKIKIL